MKRYVTLHGCYVHRVSETSVMLTVPGRAPGAAMWFARSQLRGSDRLARWQENVTVRVRRDVAREWGIIR